ncbi:MAG: hypothetical protein J5833_04170 [Victivallales bacterium]|nr:hypothetical protein [Victivallales bacterium]
MAAKRKKALWIAVAALIVLAAAYGAYIYFSGDDEAATVVWEEVEVKRGGAEKMLHLRGVLQTAQQIPVVSMTRGRITEMQKQGTPVKKGDVLFRIDDTNAREEIENYETSLNNAQLAIEQLKAQYNLVEFQEDKNVKQCQERLAHAELEEREELSEPNERDRRLMEIEEELAKLDVTDAEENYEREKRMYDKKYISLSALEPYERALENAKATLEELLLANGIKRKGATEERRVELHKNVERAKANLERVGLRRKRRLDDIKARLDASEKELASIEFALKHSQAEIDAATVVAPADGVFKILSYRDWSSGGLYREIAVGDEKRLYDVVGHIIDPRDMRVRLVVNEADFAMVKEGMEVDVTFPAMPGKFLKGTVGILGAIGKDRSRVDPTAIGGGDSEVSMFNAEISIEGDGTEFHPGMSAMIAVRINGKEDGLFISRGAIVRDGGKSFVYVGTDGSQKEVFGHDYNEMLFRVTGGLEEGDRIFIRKTVQR